MQHDHRTEPQSIDQDNYIPLQEMQCLKNKDHLQQQDPDEAINE